MAGDSLDRLSLRATGADFAYDMELRAKGPLVFHGQDGYSVKSAQGQASYYYSQPFYDIAGTLELPGGTVEVTARPGSTGNGPRSRWRRSRQDGTGSRCPSGQGTS